MERKQCLSEIQMAAHFVFSGRHDTGKGRFLYAECKLFSHPITMMPSQPQLQPVFCSTGVSASNGCQPAGRAQETTLAICLKKKTSWHPQKTKPADTESACQPALSAIWGCKKGYSSSCRFLCADFFFTLNLSNPFPNTPITWLWVTNASGSMSSIIR